MNGAPHSCQTLLAPVYPILPKAWVASIHELPRRCLLGNPIMISFSLVEGIVLSTQPSPLGGRQPRPPLVTLGVTARDPYRLADRACTPPPQKRGAQCTGTTPRPVRWKTYPPPQTTPRPSRSSTDTRTPSSSSRSTGDCARCTAVSRSR